MAQATLSEAGNNQVEFRKVTQFAADFHMLRYSLSMPVIKARNLVMEGFQKIGDMHFALARTWTKMRRIQPLK